MGIVDGLIGHATQRSPTENLYDVVTEHQHKTICVVQLFCACETLNILKQIHRTQLGNPNVT